MEKTPAEQAGFTGQGFTGDTGAPVDGADDLIGEDYDLGADPLFTDGPAKKKKKGMLIVVLVVGLAAGSLFAMHTLTQRTAASGRTAEIDKIIGDFLNSPIGAENPNPGSEGPDITEAHREIVDVLTNNYVEHQVKRLERNPFVLSDSGGGESGNPAPGLGLSAVQRAFAKLNLKSVIGGSRPLANINGKIVRVNQVMPVPLSKMEGEIKFRVKEITRDSVTVEAVGVDLAEPFVRKLQLKRKG